ncbi:MAG: hypothetical protein KDI90_06755 [Alphaproteobacteria bacterium]|nr:hypothetical protein [Alphaproteobacteria bacterium]MCB9975758.1 hypothetical protein [Rhodospirillales bacterium]
MSLKSGLKIKLLLTGAVVTLSPALLGGCEMYAPATLSTEKIEVHEEPYFLNVSAQEADEEMAARIAHHYARHAGGPLKLGVTYDSKNYRNTAMKASQKAADLAKALRENGVDQVETDILPVHGQGDESRVLVSYDSFSAHAPANCSTMPGVENRVVEYDQDYRLGCTIQTMVAKQVSRPKDLEGQGATGENTDGRSATNIVDLVRSGAENKELGGESASGQN